MSYDTIRYSTEGHVVSIGLNRPQKRNAFNLQMLRELGEAYTAYESDPHLRCAVLYAEGAHFTGGLDLAEVGPAVAAGAPLFPAGTVDPLAIGRARTKPVVCAVQGTCFTLGIELMLASDINLCADQARFNQLEVGRGIMPFGGATLRFPRLSGWGNAMRWMLTAEDFDAAEALRIGLVQHVLPADQLLPKAQAIAQRIAAQAPLAVQATLAASRLTYEDMETMNRSLMAQVRTLMSSEDATEGVLSFMERRAGTFQGE